MRFLRSTTVVVSSLLIVCLSGCGGDSLVPSPSSEVQDSPSIVTSASTEHIDVIEGELPEAALPATDQPLTAAEEQYVSAAQQQVLDFWSPQDACHYVTAADGTLVGDVCMRAADYAGGYYVTTYDPLVADHSGIIVIEVNMNAAPVWFMYRDYSQSPLVWALISTSDPAPNADTTYFYVTINGMTDWYPSSQVVFEQPVDGLRVPAWDPSVTVFSYSIMAQIYNTQQQIPGSSY